MIQRKPGWLHKNYDIIRTLIPDNAKVLDLGCGNGAIIRNLQADRNIHGMGVEIDEEKVIECVKNGVTVVQSDLDGGLPFFSDQSFDYVILNQTLQVVRRPDFVIGEMLRVGKKAIVGFPNFGYAETRMALMVGGRMPVNKQLPYEWYDSPNIHLCTVKDFVFFCRKRGIRILDAFYLQHARANIFISLFPNFLATEAVFLLGREEE